MDGNKKDTPPNLFVPAKEDRKRWSALEPSIAKVKKEMAGRGNQAKAELAKWQEGFKASRKEVGQEGLVVHLPLNEGNGKELKGKDCQKFELQGSVKWIDGNGGKAWQITNDGFADLGNLGDFEHDQPFSYGAWVRTTSKINAALFAKMDTQGGHRGWDL